MTHTQQANGARDSHAVRYVTSPDCWLSRAHDIVHVLTTMSEDSSSGTGDPSPVT